MDVAGRWDQDVIGSVGSVGSVGIRLVDHDLARVTRSVSRDL